MNATPDSKPLLTKIQIERLLEWKGFLDTDEGREWIDGSAAAIDTARSILYSKKFASGTDLTRHQFADLFKAMRRMMANRALAPLASTVTKRRRLNRDLRALVHGTEPLEKRIDRLAATPGIGPTTISHFLFVVDSNQYPLVSEPASRVLAIARSQWDLAEDFWRSNFDIQNPDGLNPETAEFLRSAVVYEAAKRSARLDSFNELNKLLWRIHTSLNVLFVNIGWAKHYDGRESVRGTHGWIAEHDADQRQISEWRAFGAGPDGIVSCGVGDGGINVDGSIDVVFIARNPATRIYETVGIYFSPEFKFVNVGDPPRKFGIAEAERYFRVPVSERLKVDWPSGRSMRRWAKQGERKPWPALLKVYEDIHSMASDDQSGEQNLLYGQLYGTSPSERKAIERQAIQVAKEYFASPGVEVIEMPTNNPGFDLLVVNKSAGEEQKVEVKGTRHIGTQVLISRTEFRLLQTGESTLAVVSDIELNSNGTSSGGEIAIYDDLPAELSEGHVVADPLQYRLILE